MSKSLPLRRLLLGCAVFSSPETVSVSLGRRARHRTRPPSPELHVKTTYRNLQGLAPSPMLPAPSECATARDPITRTGVSRGPMRPRSDSDPSPMVPARPKGRARRFSLFKRHKSSPVAAWEWEEPEPIQQVRVQAVSSDGDVFPTWIDDVEYSKTPGLNSRVLVYDENDVDVVRTASSRPKLKISDMVMSGGGNDDMAPFTSRATSPKSVFLLDGKIDSPGDGAWAPETEEWKYRGSTRVEVSPGVFMPHGVGTFDVRGSPEARAVACKENSRRHSYHAGDNNGRDSPPPYMGTGRRRSYHAGDGRHSYHAGGTPMDTYTGLFVRGQFIAGRALFNQHDRASSIEFAGQWDPLAKAPAVGQWQITRRGVVHRVRTVVEGTGKEAAVVIQWDGARAWRQPATDEYKRIRGPPEWDRFDSAELCLVKKWFREKWAALGYRVNNKLLGRSELLFGQDGRAIRAPMGIVLSRRTMV